MKIKKLYCYVDESGQDTKGKIFIVSVVVMGNERDILLQVCEGFEEQSDKGKVKWRKSSYKSRVNYLSLIFTDKRFRGKLRYEVFKHTKSYDIATIEGIVHAVKWHPPSDQFTTLVYIDGLAKTKRHKYGAKLRHLGVPTHKVQGVPKDENNALIRLADGIAGFIRDISDGKTGEVKKLFAKAKDDGVLIEV